MEINLMVQLQLLDWIWIALFLLLMIGCGVLFYRLGKRSESDFFLAGLGLPLWLSASSVIVINVFNFLHHL